MTLRKVAPSPEDRDPEGAEVLAEYERLLSGDPARWVRELAGGEIPDPSRTEMRAMLWLTEEGAPAGLALWDFVPGVGRRVWVYLREGHRAPDDLANLLDDLDARGDQDGPLASVLDFIPGVSPDVQAPVFSARGFFPTERLVLRLPADAELPDEALVGRPDLRALEPADEEGLVSLMREAYDSLAGEPLPWLMYRDPRQDARDAVREILEGRRGDWLPWASFGIETGGKLQGASLVTKLDVPILSEVMVAPALRRIGLGYYLALESVRVLRERDAGELHAVVSSQDLRALRLFHRLGFEASDLRAVGLWVSRVAIGVPLPRRP
jgi:ribosomal protein S18 acetylase RimI-like enzyme